MNRHASPWLRLFDSTDAQGARKAHGGPSAAELWLWGLCIFLLTNPFFFILTGVDPNVVISRDPSTMRQADSSQTALYAIRFGVLAIGIAMAVPRWRLLVNNLGRMGPVIPFVLWSPPPPCGAIRRTPPSTPSPQSSRWCCSPIR
jgi:hypothetical protein